jgi:hypothetical protein
VRKDVRNGVAGMCEDVRNEVSKQTARAADGQAKVP